MTDVALNEDTRIGRRDSVVSADVADDAILLDIDSGYFFQLNRTAARIWSLLETPQTFGQLCATLQQEYAMAPATCQSDVGEFVADLSARGVVQLDVR